jgi:2-iminobutanoate/2-iminopropanoate deaminase
MTRKSVVSDLLPAALSPYSHAMVAGGFVFCSGTAGIDPATGTVRDGIEAQASTCTDPVSSTELTHPAASRFVRPVVTWAPHTRGPARRDVLRCCCPAEASARTMPLPVSAHLGRQFLRYPAPATCTILTWPIREDPVRWASPPVKPRSWPRSASI